jgi:hypothetical protein
MSQSTPPSSGSGSGPSPSASVPPARKPSWRPSSRPSGPASHADWQRLWVALQKRKWQTLGILGASTGMKSSPMEAASILADIGWQHLGQPIQVMDLRETPLNLIETRLAELRLQHERGERVFVVLSPVVDNPTTVAMAPHVDGLVLCLVLGTTSLSDAEKTIDELGRDSFLGTIILRNAPKIAKAKTKTSKTPAPTPAPEPATAPATKK